jgi:UDPglucose 6-dehydrogenase
MEKIKITTVGSGCLVMSLAILLAQKNEVTVLDIDPYRVNKINNRESTIRVVYIESYFAEKELNLFVRVAKFATAASARVIS